MKLAWLEDFAVLAESRNFSEAAKHRHITQPAFSRRIAMLESWLGVQLIERGKRYSELTPTAARFASDLRRLADMTYELRNQMRADACGPPKIKLVMQHTLMITHFPALVARFQSTSDDDAFDARTADFDDCFERLSRGEADVVLCFKTNADLPSIDHREFDDVGFGRDRLVPVATPSFAAPLLRRASDHTPIKLISYPERSFLGRAIRRECLPELIRNHIAHTVFESAFTAGVKAMALSGMGMAWLPESLVQHELWQGSLVALDTKFPSVPLEIVLYRSAHESANSHLQALWSSVRPV